MTRDGTVGRFRRNRAKPDVSSGHRVTILLVFLIVVLLCICVFVLVLLSAVFRAAYGWEMMLAGLNCEVSVHSAPDGTPASVVTLRQSESRRAWLRHYIYDHPHCATTIAHWIAARLQPK